MVKIRYSSLGGSFFWSGALVFAYKCIKPYGSGTSLPTLLYFEFPHSFNHHTKCFFQTASQYTTLKVRVTYKHLESRNISIICIIIFLEFPTNRTELNAVFDIFDRNHSGELDYREFVDALRPERQVCRTLV